MTPKQFIEKAIEGGWKGYSYCFIDGEKNYGDTSITKTIIDPLAWQAVGKVEGWIEDATGPEWLEERLPENLRGGTLELAGPDMKTPLWKWNMHAMIDALCEGMSIEQFLETI